MLALVFAYDLNPDGSLHRQLAARCNEAVRLYKLGDIAKIYLTTYKTGTGTTVGMAPAMQEYLLAEGVRAEDICVAPYGGNTAGEMDAFFEALPFLKIYGVPPELLPVTFVTSWYHVPRVMLLMWARRPRDWFYVAWTWRGTRLGDLLKEPLAFANSLLRPKKSSDKHARIPALN